MGKFRFVNMSNGDSIPYKTFSSSSRHKAIEYAKRVKGKVLTGRRGKKRVYYAGKFTEPMLGTVYKYTDD